MPDITTREQKGSPLTFDEVDANFVNPNSALVSIADSLSRYHEHTQPTASTTWTINHNFGRRAAISLFTTGGATIFGDVMNINLNQSIASFDEPIAGYAIAT